MWRLVFALFLLALSSPASGAERWLGWVNADLWDADFSLAEKRAQLAALGVPVVGNTVPQFGYQHPQRPVPPPESAWVQVDLGGTLPLDTVALVPALVDFQPIERGAFGFPRRFRVDLSDDPTFARFTPLLVHTDEDFPPPGAAPVVIAAEQRSGRYLRVTVTRLAEEGGVHFFALAELIALSGARNVAIGAPVTASRSANLPPRWGAAFLTDGRTPLGPPIRRAGLPEFDALFAAKGAEGSPAWMAVDLGRVQAVEEVRLHPLHARQGADVPGFRFPLQFRVELSEREDFAGVAVIFDTGGVDFPNPGNNPVTLPATDARGRFVRIVVVKHDLPTSTDFALSELEVQVGGGVASRGARVWSSGDPLRNPPRPLPMLTDGDTSYGALVELPQWLQEWARRAQLQAAIREIERALPALEAAAQRRAWGIAGTALAAMVLGVLALNWRAARRREREAARFREQLAQDLHDEIGSNLAGIAMIGEFAAGGNGAGAEEWQRVRAIARETTDAMREVLWLVGARQEKGVELLPHLQLAAERLLRGRRVEWTALPAELPASLDAEARRQIFLIFKEALANVVHHARATAVQLAARCAGGVFELTVCDDGRGFDPAANAAGMGRRSQRERARRLGGTIAIASSPGAGTTVTLRVPFAETRANPHG